MEQIVDSPKVEQFEDFKSRLRSSSRRKKGSSSQVVTSTPLLSPATGNKQPRGCERTPEVEINDQRPRKLFPLFDVATWNKASHKATNTEQQTPPVSRKRKASRSEEDPLDDFRLKRKKFVDSKPSAKDICFLDFGQKVVGAVTCKVCGMVYTLGLPEDESDHLRFHNSFVTGVAFAGWKKENVLLDCKDGRIIVVTPADAKAWIKKVCDICRVVDSELGYADSVPVFREGSKAYLFISIHKRVAGCLVTDTITQGFRMLPSSPNKDEEPTAPACCSLEAERAEIGINRLWVSKWYRRKGIATRLVDTARSHHSLDCTVPLSLVAFSDPSPAGRSFAESYTSTQTYLVYQWYG